MKISSVTMDLQLKVTILLVVWFSNTNKCYMMNLSSESNLDGVTSGNISTTTPPESPKPDLDGLSSIGNSTKKTPEIDNIFDNTTEVNMNNIDTKSNQTTKAPEIYNSFDNTTKVSKNDIDNKSNPTTRAPESDNSFDNITEVSKNNIETMSNSTSKAPEINNRFDNTTEVTEKKTDTTSCSKEQSSSVFFILRCPDILAFNKYPIERENGSLKMEFDHVGGLFNLTREYGQVKLVSLKIQEANLTSLDSLSESKFLDALKKLDISNNPDFDAQSLFNIGKRESLVSLSMRGIDLHKLGEELLNLLLNYPNLEYLDVSNTRISHLDVPNNSTSKKFLHSLKELDLSGNPEFDAQALIKIGLDSLTHLTMRGISLKKPYNLLKNLLHNYANLEYLDVSYTGIFFLDPYIFASNKKLKHLDLSGNDKLCFIEIHIDTIRQLKYLNISNCSLKKIIVEDENKRSLNIKKDRGIMEKLDVSNNNLIEIPSSLLNALNNESFFVNISRNFFGEASENCKTYDLWRFNQSHPIDDSHVRLVGREQLDFKKRIALSNCEQNSCPRSCICNSTSKTVDCRNKGLKTIPWVVPSSTEILLLQNNELTTLEGIQSPALCNLKTLDVGYNKISQISLDNAIKGNCKCASVGPHDTMPSDCLPQNLRKLILKNNDLGNKTKSSCQLISPVHELDISGNEITDFRKVCDASLEHLEIVYLPGNEIANTLVKSLYPKLEEKHTPEDSNVNISNHTGETINDSSNITESNCTEESNMEAITNILEYEQIIWIIIAIVFVCFFILSICKLFGKNIHQRVVQKCRPSRTVGKRKKYDCFVVSSSDDFTQVKEMVILPLTQRGYSIAWHDNAFVPGDWIMHNVERAVQNSSRMLIFATKNLISSRWGLHEIRRGCHEEFVNRDFKILALVTPTLPKTLNRDLYEIVCLRKHVKLTDNDYIEQICGFLPPLEPLNDYDRAPSPSETLNTINELLERYEEIRRQERRSSSRRLVELFHTHRKKDKVSIKVDIATAFSSHVCDDEDTCISCQKERSAIIQRFKRINSWSALNLSYPSGPQEYMIKDDSEEDITDILKEDSFIRNWMRTTR